MAIQSKRKKSAIHTTVVGLCKKAFPGFTIMEEEKVQVQGQRQPLYLDVAIRELKVAIECHGEQHFKFVSFFHDSREDFVRAQGLDRVKEQAIKSAGWTYMMIRFDEYQDLTPASLTKLITRAIEGQPNE